MANFVVAQFYINWYLLLELYPCFREFYMFKPFEKKSLHLSPSQDGFDAILPDKQRFFVYRIKKIQDLTCVSLYNSISGLACGYFVSME